MDFKLLGRAFVYSVSGLSALGVFLLVLRGVVRFTNSLPKDQQVIVAGLFSVVLCTFLVYYCLLSEKRGVGL